MNNTITLKQAKEIAQQSAKYFFHNFEQDELDITTIIEMLTDLCTEHKELAIHFGLVGYCQLYKHDLPQHYLEIASEGDAYDYYCKELTDCLLSLNRIAS